MKSPNLLKRIAAAFKPEKAVEPASPINPALRKILKRDASGSWMAPSLATYTPAYIEMILRQGLHGNHEQAWELFNLMEDTWPRLLHNLETLKREVLAMQWTLNPWCEEGEDPSPEAEEKAKLVTDALCTMRPDPATDEGDFEDLRFDLLDAWGKGMSVVQVAWETREAGGFPDSICPRASQWWHPKNYGRGQDGTFGERVGMDSPSYTGNVSLIPFNPSCFIIGKARAKSGDITYAARLRTLAWWWCALNFSSDWLLNLAQVFGLPFRWANYNENASSATVDKICAMLENMGSAGWAAFPEGTTMSLVEPSKTGSASPQADLLERADKQCDILILGQTLTTDVGDSGSRALGSVQESSRDKKIKSAGDWCAKLINQQLVAAIVRENYGEETQLPYYTVSFVENEDAAAMAQRDQTLISMGLEMSKAWLYERHGVPQPTDGEEVIEKADPAEFGLPGQPGQPPKPGFPKKGEEDKEDEDSEDEEDMQGSAKAVAQALASDMDPVRERLNNILAIRDEVMMLAKLRELLTDLSGDLKEDIMRDPKLARAVEGLISDGFKKGLKQ